MTEQPHGDGSATTRGRPHGERPHPRPRWVTAFLIAAVVVVVVIVLHVTGLAGGTAMHE